MITILIVKKPMRVVDGPSSASSLGWFQDLKVTGRLLKSLSRSGP
jgi:hypothetical protein